MLDQDGLNQLVPGRIGSVQFGERRVEFGTGILQNRRTVLQRVKDMTAGFALHEHEQQFTGREGRFEPVDPGEQFDSCARLVCGGEQRVPLRRAVTDWITPRSRSAISAARWRFTMDCSGSGCWATST